MFFPLIFAYIVIGFFFTLVCNIHLNIKSNKIWEGKVPDYTIKDNESLAFTVGMMWFFLIPCLLVYLAWSLLQYSMTLLTRYFVNLYFKNETAPEKQSNEA